MKKRLTAITLVICALLGLLPLSSCRATEADNTYVTRGTWISMLAEAFGMDTYQSEEPYYSDIGMTSDLFNCVQATTEWGVLSIYSENKLEADEPVTREEAACTAAIAAGFEVSDDQFNSDGSYNSTASISYAVEQGIISDSYNLSAPLTMEECEVIIDAARSSYLSAPFEEKTVAVFSEDIEDLSGLMEEEIEIDDDGGRVLVSSSASGGVYQNSEDGPTAIIETANGEMKVSIGDVFTTAATTEHPFGVAYKVASIDEIDGEIIITTEEPELSDLYEELDVHTTVSADLDNIIWADGISSVSGANGMSANDGGNISVNLLSVGGSTSTGASLAEKTYTKSISRSFVFSSGNVSKTWSSPNSSISGDNEGTRLLEDSNFVYNGAPSIEDFKGTTESWTQALEIENKFSAGYKITGTISINAITVTTQVQYKKTKVLQIPYGVECASVQVDSSISSSLTLEGNLNEKLTIATIPIPIAATGLTVSVDLYLYVDASGSLQVSTSLSNTAKVEYSNSNLKRSADSTMTADVKAALEINFGAELSASLDALGIVKIMDAGAKVGGNSTASAYVGGTCEANEEDGVETLTYKESMNIQADLYVPLISVSVGGSNTLIGKFGLSKTWTIKDKSSATKISIVDKEWVFWEATVVNGELVSENLDDDVSDIGTDAAEVANGEVGATDDTKLDLTTYVITLNGEPRQLELDLDDGATIPDVVWLSEDPSIATVDSNGLVSPVSTGSTVIIVSLRDDPSVYVRCAVYVQEIGENNWEFLPPEEPQHT